MPLSLVGENSPTSPTILNLYIGSVLIYSFPTFTYFLQLLHIVIFIHGGMVHPGRVLLRESVPSRCTHPLDPYMYLCGPRHNREVNLDGSSAARMYRGKLTQLTPKPCLLFQSLTAGCCMLWATCSSHIQLLQSA